MKILHILLLEDYPIHAELFRETLIAGGIPCEMARVETRADFLAALQQGSFDVILADYKLPTFDGLTALTLAQETCPDIPFILVSGQMGEEVAVEALKRGATDYVLKTGLSRLAPSVRRALREAEERAARKQAEAALRESEERYRQLFENAIDGIVVCHLDGTIVSVNRGVEVIMGCPRENLIGYHYEKFITVASAALAAERMRRALAGEKVSPIFEAEAVREDGTIIPIEMHTRWLYDQARKPEGVQAIFRDISARKALEQQRADFLAMLTHDIRTPLGVILGYSEIMLEATRTRGSKEEVENLQRLRHGALRLHALVTNYLDFSKIEATQLSLSRRPVALNRILLQVGEQGRLEAQRRHLDLDFQLQRGLPSVVGDAIALERVFGNLLHNALKFTPEAGRVTISSTQLNGEVIASIADTGPGIATEEIPLIFERYQRVKKTRSQEGTGLGLFIVKSLVEAHGGRVTVKSTLGVGSCFSVFLPTTADQEDAR